MFKKTRVRKPLLPLVGLCIFAVIVMLFGYKSPLADTKIVYLALDENDVMNLWAVSLADAAHPEHLTQYDVPGTRIFDYQIADDGRSIVYGNWNTGDPSENEIMLLDLQTRQTRTLTSCTEVSTNCYQFSIRPDGRFVTYYQRSLNALTVRLIDLSATPYSDRMIYEFEQDNNYHHALPHWAGDTGLLVFNLPGAPFEFQLFDVEHNANRTKLPLGIPSREALFSPDGSRYAYYQTEVDMIPRIIEVRETDNPEEPISRYEEWELVSDGWDGGVIYDWHPDNEHLLIAIQYQRMGVESSYMESYLALLNTTSGEIEMLPHNDNFSDYGGSWNVDGTRILFQRHNDQERYDCSCDQLMIFDIETGQTTTLPIIGLRPSWVNN